MLQPHERLGMWNPDICHLLMYPIIIRNLRMRGFRKIGSHLSSCLPTRVIKLFPVPIRQFEIV